MMDARRHRELEAMKLAITCSIFSADILVCSVQNSLDLLPSRLCRDSLRNRPALDSMGRRAYWPLLASSRSFP